ncbi:TlpA family protein disulfide reductase [Sapientia aquatica]|uniref:Redoxin domain-containing protein n=1 Tax=Sapientia aquatica TaxID=1549640 RepID=A0A4V3AUN9_9BURK|nr:redoxin domain-containing protein [Sapientia aquatica]TDK65570.1 redoxin domain-containing protein [Sapientia aquatica]
MDRRQWMQFALTSALSSSAAMSPTLFAQDTKDIPKLTLSGVDANGKKIELTDFLGKTVLVSFFTAGCNLCSRDLKLMREFYVSNAKRNFVLLAVNIDPTKADFDQYSQLISLSIPKEQRFPMVWRNAPNHKDSFGIITRQPTHFVVSAKNEFIFKREGSFEPEDWDNLWTSLG